MVLPSLNCNFLRRFTGSPRSRPGERPGDWSQSNNSNCGFELYCFVLWFFFFRFHFLAGVYLKYSLHEHHLKVIYSLHSNGAKFLPHVVVLKTPPVILSYTSITWKIFLCSPKNCSQMKKEMSHSQLELTLWFIAMQVLVLAIALICCDLSLESWFILIFLRNTVTK